MDTTPLVAVQATEKRFRVLTHQPSGIGFDEDGRSMWPADGFTWRLRDEGAIKVIEDDAAAKPAPAKKEG